MGPVRCENFRVSIHPGDWGKSEEAERRDFFKHLERGLDLGGLKLGQMFQYKKDPQ